MSLKGQKENYRIIKVVGSPSDYSIFLTWQLRSLEIKWLIYKQSDSYWQRESVNPSSLILNPGLLSWQEVATEEMMHRLGVGDSWAEKMGYFLIFYPLAECVHMWSKEKIKMILYTQALESFKLSNGNHGDFFLGGIMIHSHNYFNGMLYFKWRCHCNIISLTSLFNCSVIHGS